MEDDEDALVIGITAVDGLMVLCKRLVERGLLKYEDVDVVASALRNGAEPDSSAAMMLTLAADDRMQEIGKLI